MTGRFKVRPGTGAGHWSISSQTANTGGQRQKPVLEKAARRSRQELQLGWRRGSSGSACRPLTRFQAGRQLVEVLGGDQAQQRLEQPDEGQAGHQHQRLQGPGPVRCRPSPLGPCGDP